MGTSPETGKMGIAVLSIAQDADPMRKENWTLTNVLEGGPNSWFAGSGVTHDTQRSFNQWQEGCIVPDPEGRLTIVTRIDESSWSDVAALIRVVDEHTITFDPATDFIDMPGGGKKFTIHYDGKAENIGRLSIPVMTKTGGKSTPDGIVTGSIHFSCVHGSCCVLRPTCGNGQSKKR